MGRELTNLSSPSLHKMLLFFRIKPDIINSLKTGHFYSGLTKPGICLEILLNKAFIGGSECGWKTIIQSNQLYSSMINFTLLLFLPSDIRLNHVNPVKEYLSLMIHLFPKKEVV